MAWKWNSGEGAIICDKCRVIIKEYVQPPDTPEEHYCERCFKMTDDKALHIARNPYGWSEDVVREAHLFVCDKMESYKESYENMRQFAIEKGLDVTVYYGGTDENN